MYNNEKEKRKEIFIDTKRIYETKETLISSIKSSKEHQRVIAEEDFVIDVPHGIYEIPAKVVVSKKRSLEAAREYSTQKVCVLNFASATRPGGGIENGASAQEEAICRCSTLYPCISAQEIMECFHNKHRKELQSEKMTALYNDDCIYTPDVMVFKTDTAYPKLMIEKDWYTVDIISSAAPNLRKKPSNEMNPNSGNKAVVIKASDLLQLHIKNW